MTSPLLRWLHITDLHVGKDSESQRIALASLVDSILEQGGASKFDAVLISGDLAYSGHAREYERILELVINPLRKSELFSDSKFIATPGNHDLQCDIEYPPNWKTLGSQRQEKFFNNNEVGRQTRGSRANAFREYGAFVMGNGILSPNPADKPSVNLKFHVGRSPVWIVPVVTSYFSDKDSSDRHVAPAPTPALRAVFQEIPKGDLIIALGHHPIDWFTEESRAPLKSLLAERGAIYLHGHEHRVSTQFGQRGLISLGFGATYQAPLDSQPHPYYRNSYAICELRNELHISMFAWDCEFGRWRSEKTLPADFIDVSDVLKDGYVLNLLTARLAERAPSSSSSIAAAIRSELRITDCIWISDDSPKRWTSLLRSIGIFREPTETYALPAKQLAIGHDQFRVKDAVGHYLVHAICAPGDILNVEQLHSINTELDRQEYSGGLVVTLGDLSTEARVLATQLSARKSLQVFYGSEILGEVAKTLTAGLVGEFARISQVHAVRASIVVASSGLALLLREDGPSSRFIVLSDDGMEIPESSPVISRLREHDVQLHRSTYGLTDTKGDVPVSRAAASTFDRSEYLQKSYEHFDTVKYAPLAAIGFRFKAASLSDIYVEPTAQVGGSSKRSMALTAAVNEFIDSLNLPPAQREQLEIQFRSRHGLSASAEVGAARRLYQRYNNILVLGDPGSGKTCFVKHEILSYCQPDRPEELGWYSRHMPIFVSLAEAARIVGEGKDLLHACEIVAARRGLQLPRSVIEEFLSNGSAAFFFDGLDEVGLLDKRIALLSQIGDLVRLHSQKGSRFVLTSRPAAIQPVDIPDALTYLQLNGLTEEEIRILAQRVLADRVGAVPGALGKDELQLIERLLGDAKLKPGIARLARNPLLLTLLVLVYANTGALSARRHVIYTQAVKTLVSVRGRETRRQQISEADLRTRLGAVALSILRRDIAEIPRRGEVLSVLSAEIRRGSARANDSNALDQANDYLQEVAEATGILAIHSGEGGSDEEYVTFMHYSFLEYYAAAGLLGAGYMDEVSSIVAIPRWRDVTTLLFGMLSEQADVTPLLRRILADSDEADRISSYRLLLAMECANECDVPPLASQEAIAEALANVVCNGAALYSADLRADLAKRLEPMLEVSGSIVEAELVRGLQNENAIVRAAFADLVARLGDDCPLSDLLVGAFSSGLEDSDPTVRTAVLHAIETRRELRGRSAVRVVRRALKGNLLEKQAALKAIGAIEGMSYDVGSELRDLMDDANGLIAADAAHHVLASALRTENRASLDPVIERALRALERGSEDDHIPAVSTISLARGHIELLFNSGDVRDRELAYRYAPWVRGESEFIYKMLMYGLRSESASTLQAACVNALRLSPGAASLITIADADYICSILGKRDKNVRIGIVRLLGEMPDDEQVVTTLQANIRQLDLGSSDASEVLVSARALAKHARRNPKLRDGILKLVLNQLSRRASNGFGSSSRQQNVESMLLVCESLGGVADREAWELYKLASDFHTPLGIRRQALRVFGRLVEPSVKSASAIADSLGHNDVRLNDAVYGAALAFVIHCKQRVEFVRRVFSSLSGIQDRLVECWRREVALGSETINPTGLSDIRDSLVEITGLIATYQEFSARANAHASVGEGPAK